MLLEDGDAPRLLVWWRWQRQIYFGDMEQSTSEIYHLNRKDKAPHPLGHKCWKSCIHRRCWTWGQFHVMNLHKALKSAQGQHKGWCTLADLRTVQQTCSTLSLYKTTRGEPHSRADSSHDSGMECRTSSVPDCHAKHHIICDEWWISVGDVL